MVRHPLQEATSHLLAQTCKLLRAQAHASLGGIGLCGGQQFVLHALWNEEGITHSELAGRLNVRPATITNALKRMEKAGLVERRHDTEDQRVSRAYLTDAGRDIRDAVEAVWSGLEERAFAGFDAQERARFGQFLLRIHENLLRETTDHKSCKSCRS